MSLYQSHGKEYLLNNCL